MTQEIIETICSSVVWIAAILTLGRLGMFALRRLLPDAPRRSGAAKRNASVVALNRMSK
jgi:hypothetical protein